MPHPTPHAEHLSVVLVGAFNPSIFHPEWFRRQEIIASEDADEAKVEVVAPDISRNAFAGLSLEVLQDRMTIITKDVSRIEFLQDTVLAILAKLPHTPISACGLNSSYHYDLADEGYWHKIGHALAPKEKIWEELLTQPGMESLTIKGKREGEFPGWVNVVVQPSRRFQFGVAISSNTHFGTQKTGEPLPIAAVTKYIETEWAQSVQIARKAAESIFTKIPHDD